MTTTKRSRPGHTPATTMPVRALLDFYGSPEAVEASGAASRLFGEWDVTEAGRDIAANLVALVADARPFVTLTVAELTAGMDALATWALDRSAVGPVDSSTFATIQAMATERATR